MKDGNLNIQWMLRNPVADEVMELVSCSCRKSKYCTNQCLCKSHGLKCTDLCSCNECENGDSDNEDDYSPDEENDDDAEEDDVEKEDDCDNDDYDGDEDEDDDKE